MSKPAVEVVREYLRVSFPDCEIEDSGYTLGSDLEFKIHTGEGSFLLKASMEFLMNTPPEKVRMYLDEWNIKQVLLDSKNLGAFVTQHGYSNYEREK